MANCKAIVLSLALLASCFCAFSSNAFCSLQSGGAWVGPYTLPRVDSEEGEIFAAALLPVGEDRGHVLLWREWNKSTPFPTYVIDPNNLPSPGALVSCGASIPGMKVRCVNNSEIGCPALSFDGDGRLMAGGGHAPNCGGLRDRSNTFNIFDPVSDQWIESFPVPGPIEPMNSCRHYPAGIFIPNEAPTGNVFYVIGGGPGGTSYEEYSLDNDVWTERPFESSISTHDYTLVNLISDGLFFPNQKNPTGGPIRSWFLIADPFGGPDPLFIPGPFRSSVWRYFVGHVQQDRIEQATGERNLRITLFGGVPVDGIFDGDDPVCDDASATNTLEFIDNPGVVAGGSWSGPHAVLNKARIFVKAVTLPDGKVALLGGADHDYILAQSLCNVSCNSQDVQPVPEVEIYDPVTNSSSLGPTEPVGRAYHSAALLLPDGRVFSAGGDSTSAGNCEGELDVTFYRPPYLALPRPRIVSLSSTTIARGGTIDISGFLPIGTSLAKVTLTAPGVSTHQIESKERYIELEMLPPDPGYLTKVKIPFNIWRMPVGHYMLWLVTNEGGVSRASFIKVVHP